MNGMGAPTQAMLHSSIGFGGRCCSVSSGSASLQHLLCNPAHLWHISVALCSKYSYTQLLHSVCKGLEGAAEMQAKL